MDQEKNDFFATLAMREIVAVLEAICIEPEAPTTPGETSLDALREAILTCISNLAAQFVPDDPAWELHLTQMARRRLFRFAYFPSDREIALFSGLHLKESLSKNWSEPICGPEVTTPFNLLQWLRGFACPWKGAWAGKSAGRGGQLFWLICSFLLHLLGSRTIDLFSRLFSGTDRA
ncbi:MAG: hypothetical protein HQL73_12625 [Magnetococcales bacterium]|nr:hypothetical protein [Magnetococcales bacterium]